MQHISWQFKLRAALFFARELKLYLFPLHNPTNGTCPCGTRDCSKTWKVPLTPHGYKDASNDPKVIRRWFGEEFRKANLGLLTGKINRIIVFDVDGLEGKKSLENLNLPATVTMLTRRGFHLIYEYPEVSISSSNGVFPGIDIKSDGGYIVFFPSEYPDGYYRLSNSRKPMAQLPKAFLERIASKSPDNRVKEPLVISEGRRNDSLLRLAGSMHAWGVDPKIIERTLLEHNQEICDPPLSESEVKTIAASTSRYNAGTALRKVTGNSDRSNLSAGIELGLCQEFRPMDLEDCFKRNLQDIKWLLPGFLAEGFATLTAGYPKVGKSTLIYDLVKKFSLGSPWLGRECQEGKVLILALEEHMALVLKRFRGGENQFFGKIKIVSGLIKFDRLTMEKIAEYVDENNIKLVVVDTLPYWLGLKDEASPGEMIQAWRIILPVIRPTHASWLFILHTRKLKGEHGHDVRGTSAIVGGTDISFSLKRSKVGPTFRVLESVSRFDESPSELLLQYRDGQYQVAEQVEQISLLQKTLKVMDVLSKHSDWQNADEIAGIVGFSKTRVLAILDDQIERGEVVKMGKGTKGNPYFFKIHQGQKEANGLKRKPKHNLKGKKIEKISVP